MKIVIVGAGKIGEILCRDLSTEGNDITLIEQDAKILDRVLSVSDIMGIVGNGANREVLADAGVHSADIFIAVTTNDEINLISSVMAKKMGAKYTIARVRNPEYSEQMQFMKESLGIDIMLNPEAEAADFIRKNLEYPNALNVDSFAKNKVNLVEILVEENSYLDGLKLVDFKRNHFRNLLVCIVQRGPEVYVPTGNFVLKADDRIYVTGAHADLGEFYKSLGHSGERIKSVFIVGGGRITHYLADILLKKKMKLKIVELKEERAKELSETFENAEIINGNGIDLDLLEEENPGCFDDPNKTFADLYMKSGLFISEIVKRLYQSKKMEELYPDPNERLRHIFEKQVFGLAPTEIIYRIATAYLLGFSDDGAGELKNNFKQFDSLPYAENGTLASKVEELFSETQIQN